MYDLNHPFNLERTIPVFQYSNIISFELRRPDNKTESDIALVDSTMNYDMSDLKADIIIPFDCDDQYDYPDRINLSYHSVKDNAKYYGKSAYRPSVPSADGLRYINMPHPFSLIARSVMMQPAPFYYSKESITPIFYGSGTFIGDYHSKYPQDFANRDKRFVSSKNTRCLNEYSSGKYVYSQRIDWLSDLRRNNIDIKGGLILGREGTNLSESWQIENFGQGISNLTAPPEHRGNLIELYKKHRVYLCPAGMGRWTTRLWDSASNDGVIISTDMHDYTILPRPPITVSIPDGESVSKILSDVLEDLPNYITLQKSNRELIFRMTPNDIILSFLNQLS